MEFRLAKKINIIYLAAYVAGAMLLPSKSFAETNQMASPTLTKLQARELLKQNGFKWAQTLLLKDEAQAKTKAVASELQPHATGFVRQYLAKVNQIQYGFADPGTLNWFSAGTIGIEYGIALIDTAAVARLNAARTNERLSAVTTKQYQNDLTYIMLVQFLNVQRLKRSLEVIDTNIERDNRILQAAKTKLRNGVGIKAEIARAEGLVEHDKFRRLDASTSYFRAKKDLASLFGLNQLPAELGPLTLNPIDAAKFSTAGAATSTNRPDMQAAQLQVELADNFRKEIEKESLPRLSVFGDIGTFGSSIVSAAGGSLTGTLGIQLTLPLLTGGLNKARAQEENVKSMNASLQQKQLLVDTQNQIDDATAQLRDTDTAIHLSERQIELAKIDLEASQKKLSAGVAIGLDLANAQVNLAGALDTNVQAVFAYEVAKVNYFKAVGDFEPYFGMEK